MHERPGRSLAEVRAAIDDIDGQLVRLLAQRQGWVREAARFKTDADAVRAPERVAAVLTKINVLARAHALDPGVAEAVWRAMIGAFIDLELRIHQQAERPHGQ